MYWVWHYLGVSILSEFLTFKCMTTDGSLYTLWKLQPTKDYFHILQKTYSQHPRQYKRHIQTMTHTPSDKDHTYVLNTLQYSLSSHPAIQTASRSCDHQIWVRSGQHHIHIFNYSANKHDIEHYCKRQTLCLLSMAMTKYDCKRHYCSPTWFKLPFSHYFSVIYWYTLWAEISENMNHREKSLLR